MRKNRMGATRTTQVHIESRVKRRVRIWACNVPVREHQASGARRESEPVVSRLGSSLVGGNTGAYALTAPKMCQKPNVPTRR